MKFTSEILTKYGLKFTKLLIKLNMEKHAMGDDNTYLLNIQ